MDNVEALEVSISRIEARRSGGPEAGGEPWISIGLETPVLVDLLTLPADYERGLLVAREELPAGTYGQLRLNISEASVVFRNSFRVGNTAYAAGERIPLTVPSGRIALQGATFTVTEEAGAEIGVVFDPDASVRKIVATGSGKLSISPVVGLGKRR
jgi:hypothetical protein